MLLHLLSVVHSSLHLLPFWLHLLHLVSLWCVRCIVPCIIGNLRLARWIYRLTSREQQLPDAALPRTSHHNPVTCLSKHPHCCPAPLRSPIRCPAESLTQNSFNLALWLQLMCVTFLALFIGAHKLEGFLDAFRFPLADLQGVFYISYIALLNNTPRGRQSM